MLHVHVHVLNYVCSLQSLLELMEDKIHVDDDDAIVLGAMQCLCDLSHHLHVRLTAVSDPVLLCPDQGLYNTLFQEIENPFLYRCAFVELIKYQKVLTCSLNFPVSSWNSGNHIDFPPS